MGVVSEGLPWIAAFPSVALTSSSAAPSPSLLFRRLPESSWLCLSLVLEAQGRGRGSSEGAYRGEGAFWRNEGGT